ncbi:hypothetical protein ISS30_08840 [bacterium]|nr:hypothetical protein [bacterium]
MWCHASPHDTKILLLLYMVSTTESRHHIIAMGLELKIDPESEPVGIA